MKIKLTPDKDILVRKTRIGEPFYAETLKYVENLQKPGVEAEVDVYHTNMHAFDMLRPDLPESRKAIRKFEEAFAYAAEHYFAENE